MAGLVERGETPRLLVVCGPTATGKTELAIRLARGFGGELLGADSMQVYRGLPIGTAAPTKEELGALPCHLCGSVPPEQPYSLANWLMAANAAIADMQSRGVLPVVCGGTGLYISSLLRGTGFEPQPPNTALAATLEAEWRRDGGEAMLRKLAVHDPCKAKQLHPNDRKRILRALEQVLSSGQNAAEREARQNRTGPAYSALCLGLSCPQRAALYERINTRVDNMMARGLLKEARTVWQRRGSYHTAAQAIGYKEFFPYFEGEAPLEHCTAKLKQATRNYAKRQLTWFAKLPGIVWLDAEAPNLYQQAAQKTEMFLQRG